MYKIQCYLVWLILCLLLVSILYVFINSIISLSISKYKKIKVAKCCKLTKVQTVQHFKRYLNFFIIRNPKIHYEDLFKAIILILIKKIIILALSNNIGFFRYK